jgi:hypothetical protein
MPGSRLSLFGVELGQPQTASRGRRKGSGGLTSVYGKSPVGRQGVRRNGCVACALRCGAPVDSSEKVDGPQRQRPRSHAVGQSNMTGLRAIRRLITSRTSRSRRGRHSRQTGSQPELIDVRPAAAGSRATRLARSVYAVGRCQTCVGRRSS